MATAKKRRAKGTGSIYRLGRGWRVQWKEGGKYRYKTFPSEEIARKVLARITNDIILGKEGLPPDPRGIPKLGPLFDEWLKRRSKTHRSWREDEWRWKKHMKSMFAEMKPAEINDAVLRRFIESKLDELSSSTVRLCIAELSALFTDLVERRLALVHPVRALPRSTRRLIRPAHDPKTTPFVEKLEDVRRIYLALRKPINIAYAVGAMAGLRTGEVLALKWAHVDLGTRRIHVRESTDGPLKDDESRVVPIIGGLLPLLKEWKLKTGGVGFVVPPLRSDGERCDEHTLGRHIKKVLSKLDLPSLTWYQATRHTFASQWVLGGGSLEKLREMMGHSTVQVTERYAHLRVDLFAPTDLEMIRVDFKPGAQTADKLPRETDDAKEAANQT